MTIIKLNPNTSTIKYINKIDKKMWCNKKDFETLWNLKPIERPKIFIYNKYIETPRWFQSYGKSYSFSGLKHESIDIHPIIEKYINYANILEKKTTDFDGQYFNMALVNWYKNGNDYIGEHSDDERQLIDNSSIYCFSLGDNRDFIIKSKLNNEKIKINLENNSLIIMKGTCQKTHKHSLPKRKKQNNRRISITLRKFKKI
jgi:alkylated DNA repair dioxygenase AlkB